MIYFILVAHVTKRGLLLHMTYA